MQLHPTIFHEPWWMEIASDGCGQEAVVSRDGVIVGRLPYLPYTRFGRLKVIGMPALSHVLGPVFAPAAIASVGSPTIKLFGLIGELLAQLPEASHTAFRLHTGITETLAFVAAGFSCDAEFTIMIKPAPREVLWRQMRDKTRNVIRRAEERLTVSEAVDPDVFLAFYEKNLRQRGRKNRYHRRTTRSLISECLKRNAGRVLIAADSNDIHSAIFTVWDAGTEYYFMSTRSPQAHNGAVNLLIWQALQVAAQAGRIFDMDGVHIHGKQSSNLLLLTGFGGTVVPRFYVRRTKPLIQLGTMLGQLLKGRGEAGK